MQPAFPARAVRDLDIHTWSAGNCAPDFTRFTLDFEPLPSGRTGYEFVADRDHGVDTYERDLIEECAAGINLGVQLNLAGSRKPGGWSLPDPVDLSDRLDNALGGPLIAVRVVLTKVRCHIVDSAPGPHATAAWNLTQRLREELGIQTRPEDSMAR